MNSKILSFSILRKILTLAFISAMSTNTLGQWNYYCGFNWPIPPPGTSAWFFDAEFNTKDSGVFIYNINFSPSTGTFGYIRNTNNAGVSWTTTGGMGGGVYGTSGIYKIPQYNTYYIFYYLNGFVEMIISKDGGSTWQSSVFNSQNGLYGFGGFYGCDTSKYYLLTGGPPYNLIKYDNGTYDMQHAIFTTHAPTLPFFPDTAVGFIIARDLSIQGYKYNNILKSSDGGSNWTNVFIDTTLNIRNIYFIDTISGFTCGDSGMVLKTIDGGNNWQYLNTGISTRLNAIFFKSGQVGFAAGDSGVIIRTTNGGITWSIDSTGTTNHFTKIYAVNDSIMFAMTNFSSILNPSRMYSINLNSITPVWELEENQSKNISIIPNPASNKILVNLNGIINNSYSDILITNNVMNIVYSENTNGPIYNHMVDIHHLSNGVYHLIIRNEGSLYHRNFIINH